MKALAIFLLMLIFWCKKNCVAWAQKRLQDNIGHGATNILSELLKKYDKKLRPQAYGRPLVVTVDIAILNIDSISEKRMDYSMLCYFRQEWFDERLSFQSNHSVLPLNAQSTLRELWRPDTYVRNGQHSYIHRMTVPNSLLRIRSDGRILLSQRFTIRARCRMHLQKFPMDKQNCPLEIGSLGYAKEDVVYRWKNISAAEDIVDQSMSQFKIGRITMETLDIPSFINDKELSSVLVARLELIRQQGYFILQIYTPCSMMVVLSWVSFWINREAAIARCSLGVTTVLTLTTLRQSVREELPTVEYSTALDIFLFVSFGFVLAALVEYIVIHFANLSHIKTVKRARSASQTATPFKDWMEKWHSSANSTDREQDVDSRRRHSVASGMHHRNRLYTINEDEAELENIQHTSDRGVTFDYIDNWAKVMFPGLYFFFHCCYWTSYVFFLDDDKPTGLS